MTILEKMLENCEKAGYSTTKNVQKIANAKQMMFGEAEWQRCPCDGQNVVRILNVTVSAIATAIAKRLANKKRLCQRAFFILGLTIFLLN